MSISQSHSIREIEKYRRLSKNNPGIRQESVEAFINRFYNDFFRKANNPDSVERKELKTYQDHDKLNHLPYFVWEEAFRRTLHYARSISGQR